MPKNKKQLASSDSDSGPDDRTPAKKSKSEGGSGSTTNAKGEDEWLLDKTRKITVSEFKSKLYVNVREYYEKDGKLLPSKKGISLTVPQWKKLLECADEVNAKIKTF
ncbi:RNA polymerase II transcriptional coactivator [Topomyia yanbarensis]|uniref:RNA polymerase II transcriptional coactivator n=1 Tax=Topomyia yanbarensis TaxID=2498891 RepID=UPI00273CE885|nr:RNA polymerase II transcriptional coactivator [Topomyia yanbarensis]